MTRTAHTKKRGKKNPKLRNEKTNVTFENKHLLFKSQHNLQKQLQNNLLSLMLFVSYTTYFKYFYLMYYIYISFEQTREKILVLLFCLCYL